MLKAHLALEQTVETYAETVGMLSQQCQHLLELGHPESEQITKQQSHIDRLYVSLKDMVEHRKTKLEQQYWLYQLNKEVEELEKWITEREAVASSTELGHDLEEVTVLQERFTKFASETNSVGEQRMEQVNKMVNEMIDCGHSDAATIAEWKDGLNESWADLLELIETRRQMLAASQQLHKFFTDCKEVLAQITGKMKQLPEVRASSFDWTAARLFTSLPYLRKVRQLQENAAQLRTIYAGEKAEAIMVKEQEVMDAWKELLSSCEASRIQVTSVTDKVQFFSVVRENLMWMEGIMGQIRWDEPRDLTGLEVMMKHHQDLKAKVDGRSKTIQQCADLGKILIAAGNPASEEIQEKLDSLLTKQKDMVEKWDKHQERLLQQEHFQFAQETVKAEAWLKAKEPLMSSKQQEGEEAQAQTDEVEQLILRHEAFRKAAVTWKERFSSLRQLSAVSFTVDESLIKRSTMAEIVEQVQEREAAHVCWHANVFKQLVGSLLLIIWCMYFSFYWLSQARGEPYRPPSSLSAPVTRFDGRPRARDRPKPRRRPRPKEPETTRRSRSAPATGAPTTPQPPSHTAQNEGFLYRKKATSTDLEAHKSWVNVYCVLKEGKLTFYKDTKNLTATYNGEPSVDMSDCKFDPSMGYKKKKNVFILQVNDGTNFVFHAKDEVRTLIHSYYIF
uniref:PH domain-containing protein n=1 Tax=Xiphophorus couchianus TaxID=32473 RepID=A0A3B5M4V0_9TELE